MLVEFQRLLVHQFFVPCTTNHLKHQERVLLPQYTLPTPKRMFWYVEMMADEMLSKLAAIQLQLECDQLLDVA